MNDALAFQVQPHGQLMDRAAVALLTTLAEMVAASPGRIVAGDVATLAHGHVPGKGAAQVDDLHLDVGGHGHGVAAVEPRTLEIGQDVDDANRGGGSERRDHGPTPSRGVVGTGRGRFDVPSQPVEGRERLDRLRERGDLALGFRAGPRQDPLRLGDRAVDRPGSASQAHARRTIDQHHLEPVPGVGLGGQQVGAGEQERDQGHARQAQRQQQPALQTPPLGVARRARS